MEDVREWFPEGTQLTVLNVSDDGRIIVRWKLPSEPGYTNEAALRVAKLLDDAHD